MTASRQDFLWRIAGWVSLILISTLLAYRMDLNSDVLFINDFLDDLLHGGSFKEWKLAPSPQFFPDMLVDLAGYPFFLTITGRLFFVSFVEALLTFIAARFFYRRLDPTMAGRTEALIAAVTGFTVLASESSNENMMFLFNSNNGHFPHLFFSLFCLGWLWDFLGKPSWRVGFYIAIAGGLAAVSDALFFMSFTAPAFAFLAGRFIWDIHQERRLTKANSVNLAAGIVVSLSITLCHILKQHLVYADPLGSRLPMSKEGAISSLHMLTDSLVHFFDPHPLGGLVFHTFFVLCFLLCGYVLIEKLRNKQSRDILWIQNAFFFFLSFFAVLGSTILAGAIDEKGNRFFVFPAALLLLLSIRQLGQTQWFNRKLGAFLLSAVFAVLIGSGVMLLGNATDHFKLNMIRSAWLKPHWDSSEDKIADCIKSLRVQGIPLDAGVSDYWHARSVMYALGDTTVIAPVDANMAPFDWVRSYHRIAHREAIDNKPYQFIIMRNPAHLDGTNPLDLTLENVGAHLPSGGQVHECADTPYMIWSFADNKLDHAIREQEEYLWFGKTEKKPMKVSLKPSSLAQHTGHNEGSTRIAIEGQDAEGAMIFGPYVTLPKGTYLLTIHYEGKNNDGAPIGSWGWGQYSLGNRILGSGDLLPATSGLVQSEIEIHSPLIRTEIQVWFFGKGELKVSSIELERR